MNRSVSTVSKDHMQRKIQPRLNEIKSKTYTCSNMNNRLIKITFAGILFIYIHTLSAFAQSEIQREVRVVKPYSPTLSDAEKINLLPEMRDTILVHPDFNYSIVPKRFDSPFQLEIGRASCRERV